MTDTKVWDEKPKRWKYGELKSTVLMTKTFGIYRASKMDAWLEKLKSEYKSMEAQINLLKIDVEGLDKEYLILREKADKLEAIKTILFDVCDYYGTETCKEGVCDCDPNGWEGCLTRKILDLIDPSSS